MTEHAADSAPCAGSVADRLSRIAAVEVRLAGLQAELDKALDGVRRRYDARLSALRRRLANLAGDLESFCRRHRAAIMPADRKTLRTAFGEVGFRRAETAVALADGLSADEACSRLRRARLGGLVRLRYCLDKPAIRRAIVSGRVDSVRLARYGIEVADVPDSFRYKVRREPAGVCAPGEGGE